MSGLARGSRVTTMTYNAAGSVDSVTDPATRTVSFEYDGAGRVIEQELPDLRVIGFDYDANGNLTSLTPPGRPAHGFTYLPRGQLQYYWPPQPAPPLTEPRTFYDYYLDGRLSRVTRPDGEQIHLTYDPETGQLLVQATAAGQVLYSYDTATGNPSTIGVSGETLTYAYDGSLPLSETWSGTVAGSVSRAYDTSLRVIEQRVNGGSAIGFDYDDDDLLTDAGAMTLTRDPATGLLTGTALGNTTDSFGYNPFGEVMSYAATVNGAAVYSASYTRDALGRIATKTETVPGVTDVYAYVYAAAGRLTDVVQNSTAIGHYEYDANGNRIPDADGDQNLTFNQAGTLLSATYDAQDRLLGLEQGPAAVAYTYTANGELQTRTVGTDVTGYGYDVFGNLRSVTFPGAEDVIEYVVNGQSRRVGTRSTTCWRGAGCTTGNCASSPSSTATTPSCRVSFTPARRTFPITW